jgi:plastocyanin
MKINLRFITAILPVIFFWCGSPIAFCKGAVIGTVITSKPVVSSSVTKYGTVTGTVEATMARYRKGVVVYLKGVPEKVVPLAATVDQKNLAFIPHVVAVSAGSTVTFVNSDKVNHDIFSANPCKKFDIDDFHPGSIKTMTFDKPCEVNLLCDLHPEMSGFIIVIDSNHFAVTDAAGKFTIGSVPPGTYDVAVWSEKLKLQKTVAVAVYGGQTSMIDISLVK